MADDSDELPSLSWPLVERRSRSQDPPDGVERRRVRAAAMPESAAPNLTAAPLWPFRLAAIAGAVFRAANDYSWSNWTLIISTLVIVAYSAFACLRPVPYRNDARVRLQIVVELALTTVIVLVTGAWGSPFALCLIPTCMLAGFAAGGLFSAQLAAAAAAAITLQYVPDMGFRAGLQDAALWSGLLGLVAFTSGLAHRAAYDAARQQELALDRVSRLAEANSLLFALQRVAQTLPASLDLDDVLDTTVNRVRTLIPLDLLVVYAAEPGRGTFSPIRTVGIDDVPAVSSLEELPDGLRAAVESPRTVRRDVIPPGTGLHPDARSGLYASLRARGALVGLIAVEARAPMAFGQQQAEIIHGLTEPFGIAIDNARMFRRIRTLAADEERSRIARDLHDHIGSSLALIGFEIDRAASVAAEGGAVEPVLNELRGQVSAVVADVRETLYDLRTEISESKDFAETIRDFLHRVERRTGIATTQQVRINGRLPLQQERELWQILREAVTNIERHSQADNLEVILFESPTTALLRVRDDGIGLGNRPVRADSYGMVGMRERAERIGAEFSTRTPSRGGTEVRVSLRTDQMGL